MPRTEERGACLASTRRGIGISAWLPAGGLAQRTRARRQPPRPCLPLTGSPRHLQQRAARTRTLSRPSARPGTAKPCSRTMSRITSPGWATSAPRQAGPRRVSPGCPVLSPASRTHGARWPGGVSVQPIPGSTEPDRRRDRAPMAHAGTAEVQPIPDIFLSAPRIPATVPVAVRLADLKHAVVEG